MINDKNTFSINYEWDFVAKEIISYNKSGENKGKILFEFQVLLHALCNALNLEERRMLISVYRKQKEKYKEL